ncbi:hypothetical protein NDI76_18325 [Halogeometricum sp. S1BR25-6]|uniref:Uncharacterized protein n=1 Tax=Halogeometricum salsisoli TaxID=2950536 RepID=A0ABU2GIP2_9EURY|nr:hypothetical protein [Halogeometricum sp. S1BR25-6]MDS0300708.1 hypothetical protein [Halogeometricum sp. S1BR25-6]
MDLDTRDLAILLALGDDGPATASDVQTAAREDASTEAVEERLSRLAEGGLVAQADGGEYELTPSGRRLLRTETDDSASRPDVPAEAERAIETADLHPGVADALARAVVFLRNWGSATSEEIIDAAYSETDLGYDDGERWWDELVRDPFGALPGVVPPSDEGGEWRYDGSETPSDDAEEATGANREGDDGRRVLDGADDRYGSAKHALEREAMDDAEAAAFAAAFEALAASDDAGATAADLVERAASETGSSVDADRLTEALESVPGVRREGGRWRYDRDKRFWNEEDSTGE